MDSADLLMCHTCGTQYDLPGPELQPPPASCRICDDPRQFVPPTGQRWTSLRAERALTGADAHTNHIAPLTVHLNSDSTRTAPVPSGSPPAESSSATATVPNAYTLSTTPKLGIGERPILLTTPHGTVMWDLLAYLDSATIAQLHAPPFHGLKAIVISHPHYYTNHLDWAEAFDCPVYIAAEDEEWVNRAETQGGRRRLIHGPTEEIVPGVTAIKVGGGHFPGSLVLHHEGKLLMGDSLVTMPSALYHLHRPAGTISYTFMWSIPNMIPLPPAEMLRMWRALEPFDFHQTHGAFMGQDVGDPNVKGRVLESMKIQARNATGGERHELAEVVWRRE